ncbi:MAG TPA: hypothetical protein V6D13_03960 [Halomicronema sp.]
MSGRIILVDPVLAKAPVKPPVKPQNNQNGATLWMGASGVLLLAVIGLAVFSQIKLNQMAKKLRMEDFKNRELQKKYKLAVGTITKMEKNPDLVHSREFNLDYLRMRMAEETFHFSIVNQIRVKVKDKISLALRPTQETRGVARQVDEVFDVEYETGEGAELKKRVLFRIQIRLTKIPTQPTSVTIGQIIDCIETYLSTTEDNDSWQPTIQGRVAYIHWDQKAKPTPLLVLEQSNEGVNVTFATKRRGGPASTQEQIAETKPQTSLTAGRRSSLTGGKNEKTAGKPGKSSDKTSGRSTKTGKR